MIAGEDILWVLGLGFDLGRALYATSLIILDVTVVLSDCKLAYRLVCELFLGAILFGESFSLGLLCLLLFLELLLPHDLTRCRVGLKMQLVLVSTFLCLPRIALCPLKLCSIAGRAHEPILCHQLRCFI